MKMKIQFSVLCLYICFDLRVVCFLRTNSDGFNKYLIRCTMDLKDPMILNSQAMDITFFDTLFYLVMKSYIHTWVDSVFISENKTSSH